MSLGALPLEMVVHVMTALSAADMAHAAESCSVCRIALERAVCARAHLHRLSLEASRPWLQLSPFERIRMPWSFLLRVAEVRPRAVVAVSCSAASTFNLRCNTHDAPTMWCIRNEQQLLTTRRVLVVRKLWRLLVHMRLLCVLCKRLLLALSVKTVFASVFASDCVSELAREQPRLRLPRAWDQEVTRVTGVTERREMARAHEAFVHAMQHSGRCPRAGALALLCGHLPCSHASTKLGMSAAGT